MTHKMFFSSLTRISDLEDEPFEIASLGRDHWATGDYVVGEIMSPPRGLCEIELGTGRMVKLANGDRAVGALGVRHATLEAVGSWRDMDGDARMQALTAAGLFGRVTSLSTALPPLLTLEYRGHAMRRGSKLCMSDFAIGPKDASFSSPTVLFVGTSMSAGKTTSAKAVIRRLKRRNLRVVGAKLSGAGRYRDILGMADAGADAVFDFVDVGLPSSIGEPDAFRAQLRTLLTNIAAAQPDVTVVEAGASPLEPYNGAAVLQELGNHVRCTILCASDPYAVIGVMKGFDVDPDLVAGLATSTTAGSELVERLSGVKALNLLDPEAMADLDRLLETSLR